MNYNVDTPLQRTHAHYSVRILPNQLAIVYFCTFSLYVFHPVFSFCRARENVGMKMSAFRWEYLCSVGCSRSVGNIYTDSSCLRFAAECELLGQLHHPHIVQFLGVRVEAGSELPELVMEYLPTTLRRCLDTHGALPAEICGGILLEVALGLRYRHEFSPPIIHRDLSSNNILLTTSMTAKISDLGVAKILDVSPGRAARMTQTQAPGTPTFIPPRGNAGQAKVYL